MKYSRLLIVLATLVLLSAVTAGAAAATSVEECQAELAALRADTVAAESSFTSRKDFEGALAKLDAAAAKLAEGKNADAVQKLLDYQAKLSALSSAPKPKLDPAVAQTLVAGAQDAIDCIDAIGTA